MRVAVFGGGFNPPHIGHGLIATWILATGLAERVLFVPAANHPFGKQLPPLQERLLLCKALAFDLGYDGTRILTSGIEAELPSPNFSINLLRALRAKNPQDVFRFVMGADNVVQKAKWFGFDDIVAEFNPIFVNRAGVVLPEGVEIRTPQFPNLSSTEIRERFVAGQPIDHLLTTTVYDLYTSRRSFAGRGP